MPAAKDKISCPDCLSRNLKKTSTNALTKTLRRDYYSCQCCLARIRTIVENNIITDIEIVGENASAVNLVLLAIKRLDRREQAEIKRFLEGLEFPLVPF